MVRIKMRPGILFVACLAVAGAITACSHKSPVAQLQEQQAKAMQQQQSQNQQTLEAEMSAMPDWVTHTPPPDADNVYGVGSADSTSLRMAMNEAKLRAEFSLASMYKKDLTGEEQDFQRDNGGFDQTVQYTKLIDNVVDASIVGDSVVKTEMKAINGREYVWILMALPYDEFNKIAQEQRAQAKDKSIQSAFDDLERKVDKRRAEELQKQQAEHQMRMDEMSARDKLLREEQKADAPKVVPLKPSPAATAKPKTKAANKGDGGKEASVSGLKKLFE